MTPKELRKAAKLSLIAVAVGAKTSENTTRLYEASRKAVSEGPRARLDAFYAELRARLEAEG
jgi:hypothetical protein